jgi:UDP-N-acetylglucosamine transferase subunit ALG13
LIFVCVGTREYQFNRLLKKLDELIEEGLIKEDVFAQIGYSSYIPKNYSFTKFMSPEEFNEYLMNCRLVITHGGTGSIIGALRRKKHVIGVTRLRKYGEHVDDHQKQMIELFAKENYIYGVEEIDELKSAVSYFDHSVIMKKFEKESYVLNLITDFIKKNF